MHKTKYQYFCSQRKRSRILPIDVLGIVAVAVATVDRWRGCGVPRIVAVADATDGCNGTIVIGGVGVVDAAHEVIDVQAWARPHILFTLQFEKVLRTLLFFTRCLSSSSPRREMVTCCFICSPSIRFGSVAFEAARRRNDLRWPSWLPFSFLDWFSLLLLLSDSSAMNLLDWHPSFILYNSCHIRIVCC